MRFIKTNFGYFPLTEIKGFTVRRSDKNNTATYIITAHLYDKIVTLPSEFKTLVQAEDYLIELLKQQNKENCP